MWTPKPLGWWWHKSNSLSPDNVRKSEADFFLLFLTSLTYIKIYIFVHCQNTFQWNISFAVKIHLFLVFTTCKRNGEDQLIIIPSDLTLAGKKWFLLAHYAVSGVIFCVNECSAPEGRQTDRALYSSLPFRLYSAQRAPSQLPFLRPAVEQWKANPCVQVVFLLLHGFFFQGYH